MKIKAHFLRSELFLWFLIDFYILYDSFVHPFTAFESPDVGYTAGKPVYSHGNPYNQDSREWGSHDFVEPGKQVSESDSENPHNDD